jgi:hypothetical protein
MLSLARGPPAFEAEGVRYDGDDILIGPVNPGKWRFVGHGMPSRVARPCELRPSTQLTLC